MKTIQYPLSLISHKIGRNDPCFCGSGKKYKKCCFLNSMNQEAEDEAVHPQTALLETIRDKLEEQYKGKQVTIETSEEMGLVKMSEIILEFAQELLDLAKSYREKESILMLAIVAWNIAVMANYDTNSVISHIEDFLRTLGFKRNSEEKEAVVSILLALVEKKRAKFPDVHRYIIDFEVKEIKKDLHLNVASAVAPTKRGESFLASFGERQAKKRRRLRY